MSGLSPTSLSPLLPRLGLPEELLGLGPDPPPHRYQSTGSYSAPDPGSPWCDKCHVAALCAGP